MKTLSGLQPWWFAIMHLGKRIENRIDKSSAHRQMKTYREPLLLHASAGIGHLGEFSGACDSIRDVIDELTWARFRDEHLEMRKDGAWTPRRSLPRGGIVGRCRVVGLITPHGDPWKFEGIDAVKKYQPDMRWHIPGQWGHILADVQPLPFVACKGALGLWECAYEPHEVSAAVEFARQP